jgi:hypothetical protein
MGRGFGGIFVIDSKRGKPNPSQLAFALGAGIASGILWGYLTQLPLVAIMTVVTTFLNARMTSEEDEQALGRIMTAFIHGGIWAIFGSLGAGRNPFH